MAAGFAVTQDFEEPGSNSRSDHYGKLGFGSTDRSNGRGNIIPAAVSNDRFHASTPSGLHLTEESNKEFLKVWFRAIVSDAQRNFHHR
jgi:hypothetical protein